jgi:hypothetical protein
MGYIKLLSYANQEIAIRYQGSCLLLYTILYYNQLPSSYEISIVMLYYQQLLLLSTLLVTNIGLVTYATISPSLQMMS